jgi:hypothetical protein
MENGLVRVRYDASNYPGFKVDVWNGSSYVEQGKMIVQRQGDLSGYDNTWVAASVEEYTPDRAVLGVILANSADPYSNERIFITLSRGQYQVTFEAYPALRQAQTAADIVLQWTPALNGSAPDLNNSAMKVDSQGTGGPSNWTPGPAGSAVYVSTAGTGAGSGNSGQFGSLLNSLGNASFATSENWIAILRSSLSYNTPSAWQHSLLVVQQQAIAKYAGQSTAAYGIATDTYQIASQNAGGYIQCQIGFALAQAQQVLEAEAMGLGSGTSISADVLASGGSTTTATRSADAIHVSEPNWPNGFQGTFRVFARAKITTGTLHIYAKTDITTGAAVTSTSAAFVWVDLGEVATDNNTLEIHAWTGGAGTLSIDRIEAILVDDRVRNSAIYSGSRDMAQSALFDARTIGMLVAR